MAPGRKGTGLYGDRTATIHSIHTRFHESDYQLLRAQLDKDTLAFQALSTACVEAYLRRDPYVLKIIRDWQEENRLEKYQANEFSFTDKEKRRLLDAIDRPTGSRDGGQHAEDQPE
mgnify:CR=1 FL=1